MILRLQLDCSIQAFAMRLNDSLGDGDEYWQGKARQGKARTEDRVQNFNIFTRIDLWKNGTPSIFCSDHLQIYHYKPLPTKGICTLLTRLQNQPETAPLACLPLVLLFWAGCLTGLGFVAGGFQSLSASPPQSASQLVRAAPFSLGFLTRLEVRLLLPAPCSSSC